MFVNLRLLTTPLRPQQNDTFGQRLWWNWELDPSHYPNWSDMLATLAADNARVMTYINPFLSDSVAQQKKNYTRNLFKEAADQGYLVKVGVVVVVYLLVLCCSGAQKKKNYTRNLFKD